MARKIYPEWHQTKVFDGGGIRSRYNEELMWISGREIIHSTLVHKKLLIRRTC